MFSFSMLWKSLAVRRLPVVFVAVSIFFANRNGDAFEKTIINHFEMSRPADRGSVIRSDNCHAGLVIYHLEAFVIEHIEKRIIFSCSNEGEYSGYNPTHTCHMTGVRDLYSDSAVPYTGLTAWQILCFGCRDLQPLLSADCVHQPQSVCELFCCLVA